MKFEQYWKNLLIIDLTSYLELIGDIIKTLKGYWIFDQSLFLVLIIFLFGKNIH